MFGQIIAFNRFALIAKCVFGRSVVSLPTKKLTSEIGPKAQQVNGWGFALQALISNSFAVATKSL